tara:strand:+ start:637 stop:1041 length:405 start_codon:yes stop_codon:yes gene_type:complete
VRGFLIISAIFLSACINSKEEPVTIIDPNDTSEMALLMRDMFEKLEVIKDKIENNEDLSKEQLSFAAIHLQEVTDSSFIKEGLVPMSEDYIRIINQFNNHPTKENYKSIVNSCINCHISMCPGPLERIDNLILK